MHHTFASSNHGDSSWFATNTEDDWFLDPGDQKMSTLIRHSV